MGVLIAFYVRAEVLLSSLSQQPAPKEEDKIQTKAGMSSKSLQVPARNPCRKEDVLEGLEEYANAEWEFPSIPTSGAASLHLYASGNLPLRFPAAASN